MRMLVLVFRQRVKLEEIVYLHLVLVPVFILVKIRKLAFQRSVTWLRNRLLVLRFLRFFGHVVTSNRQCPKNEKSSKAKCKSNEKKTSKFQHTARKKNERPKYAGCIAT